MKPISLRISKRDKLEAEQLRLSAAWTRQLTLLADARNYFVRLREAPPSEWRSQELAEALGRRRNHEIIAAAIDTLLRGVERDIKVLDEHQRSIATARQHVAGHRGKR
jgi:hypothetical protein